MTRLRLGRVGEYFAHRWSDPTFLSGLVLATALQRGPVLELAWRRRHFLPALTRLGLAPVGADLVFAKLWLCRRFVSPDASLLCFDAGARWPLADNALNGAFCHDALYFLPAKAHVVSEMRRCCAGMLAIGHAHNARAANHSAGLPLSPLAYAELLATARSSTMPHSRRASSRGEVPAQIPFDTQADAVSFVSPRRRSARSCWT